MTERLCRVCGAWHDLDKPWPHKTSQLMKGFQIVKDIEPYRSVAADKETGKRVVVGGRRQHREFLKKNNYIEVGNEYKDKAPKSPDLPWPDGRDVKRALDEVMRKHR